MAKRKPPKSPPTPPAFVNFRGEPVDPKGAARSGQAAPAERLLADLDALLLKARAQRTPAAEAPARETAADAAADLQRVFDALCVGGAGRTRTALQSLLRVLEWRRTAGPYFLPDDLNRALQTLQAQGRAVRVEGTGQGEAWSAEAAASRARLPVLLRQQPKVPWWQAVARVQHGGYLHTAQPPSRLAPRSEAEAVVSTVLLLAAAVSPQDYERAIGYGSAGLGTVGVTRMALQVLVELDCTDLMDPATLWGLVASLDSAGGLRTDTVLMRWLDASMDAAPVRVPAGVRLRVAERRLHAGNLEGMRRACRADASDPARATLAMHAGALEAAALAWQGRWAEAAPAFAQALKAIAAGTGRRTGLVPLTLAQWYLLALLAQPDAAAWTQARKFALAQAGTRQPSPLDPWGRWAHAAAVRLGDATPAPEAFRPMPASRWSEPDPESDADALLLAAWLGRQAKDWPREVVDTAVQRLHAAGLPWKVDLVAQACERLGLPAPRRPAEAPPPWPGRFYGEPQAAWRDALAAIVALGDERGAGAALAAAPADTLQWVLRLDAHGRPLELQVLEPTPSGRGKPKALTALQLKKRARLHPQDAAVARCLRTSRWSEREVALDLVAAVQALVGHPALSLADAPGTAVELVEGLPVLQVQRQRAGDASEHFAFRLDDELLCDDPPDIAHHLLLDADRRAEAERRNGVRVLREGPQQARLLRITPAQRRVAELVAQRWTVPLSAQGEMDAALRVLSGHFLLHSDAEAGEPVPSEARLVALLQPRGDALQLQLAVRPFGDFGPLLAPGHGRQRLLTQHAGVSLATERALAAERAHLSRVLQAVPFLDESSPDATWVLDDPEQALAAVQALGTLSAPAAVADVGAACTADDLAAAGAGADAAPGLPPVRSVEWPRGKPLRVLVPPPGAIATTLRSSSDWLALQGELQVEEGRVISLQQTLALLREHGGQRYIPLGQGEYLALTERLRQRLADLDALAQAQGNALRVGATAAAWLAEAAEDLGLKGDAAWRERAARLEQAADLQPPVPGGLQAQLRPYQHEGLAWMLRLAHAGFGACLADDMGLGKTVQTLGLLLARAGTGPALVLAPTSVCRNWADEAARFAPALNVRVHGQDAVGEGGRAGALSGLGAGDVLVASYGLLLRDAEAFAEVGWGTLVMDEAQALKNAATQRVKAVGELRAGFRLALTGTPVENRLADLWSLMNLLNPGLLGSAQRFGERFAGPIERQRDRAAQARLRRLVSPFLLRRTKAQVLGDLPPRTEIVQRVEPGPEERAFLEAARRAALARVAQLDPADGRSAFNVLAELTRLRRAACDPRLTAPELGMVGAKVQAFERLAVELAAGGHQTLVFSQFTDFLKLMAERLSAAGLRWQLLDGSTPAAARAERVAAFQRGEADLFLISLKAGGFGLNLTAADYVVIADPWWNPAAEDQAMGRAHRIGQKRPVTVYRLVTAGSVEERIVALHQDKRDLAEGLLEGQDSGAPLRAEELVNLLREA